MFASLRLFNAVVADSNNANYTYSDYSIISDYGVVISPSANYKKDEIIEFLKKERVSFEKMNNGFYKNWDKIFTVEINERLRDQCMHYFSTYGLEAFGINSPNFVYLPEGTFEVPEMNKLTVIKGVKKEFLIESCFKLLGGMALKQETINDVLEVLGQKGYVRADLARGQTIDLFTLAGSDQLAEKAETERGWLKIPHEEARTWGWYAEIKHFASVLLDNVTPIVTGDDGLRALQVAIAAYESAKSNQRIEIKY